MLLYVTRIRIGAAFVSVYRKRVFPRKFGVALSCDKVSAVRARRLSGMSEYQKSTGKKWWRAGRTRGDLKRLQVEEDDEAKPFISPGFLYFPILFLNIGVLVCNYIWAIVITSFLISSSKAHSRLLWKSFFICLQLVHIGAQVLWHVK